MGKGLTSCLLEHCRNREGLNDWIYEREHPDEIKSSS